MDSHFINIFIKGPASMTLTKSENIAGVAEIKGYSRNKASKTVKTVIELVKSSLESGEDILISGFGKFCVKNKKERRGRNPATGDDSMLAPRKIVTFKCSGKVRDKINGN